MTKTVLVHTPDMNERFVYETLGGTPPTGTRQTDWVAFTGDVLYTGEWVTITLDSGKTVEIPLRGCNRVIVIGDSK